MSYHREDFVRNRIKALSILIRGIEEDEDGNEINQITDNQLDRLIRMLRPTNHQVHDYAKAVKIRLRQSILNHPHINSATGTTSNEGPLLLARFDKEVETFGRMNPSLIHPFLVLLKPLSFYEPPKRLVEKRLRKSLPAGGIGSASHTPATALHSRQIISAEEKLSKENAAYANAELLNKRNALNKTLLDQQQQQKDSAVRISITQPQPPLATTAVKSSSANVSSNTIGVDTSLSPSTALNAQQLAMHWVTPEIERKLLIDLVYVLQVRFPFDSIYTALCHIPLRV